MVIEIVGMTITVPDLIWTIIDFVILYFLLRKLLFKPLLGFVDARNAKVKEGLDIGAQAEKELEDTKQLMEDEVSRSKAEARSMIEDARARAEEQKAAAISEARAKSLKLREEIKGRISGEKAEEAAQLDNKMTDYVTLLSNRLLHSNEATGKTEFIESCVNAAKSSAE